MLRLELGQIIDIFIYNKPEVIRLLMRRNVVHREGFRHGTESMNSDEWLIGDLRKNRKEIQERLG